jgi:hypothetical protein
MISGISTMFSALSQSQNMYARVCVACFSDTWEETDMHSLGRLILVVRPVLHTSFVDDVQFPIDTTTQSLDGEHETKPYLWYSASVALLPATM